MSEQEMERFTCADVRAVFLRWEKLRILYNLIVGAVGVAALVFCVLASTDLLARPIDIDTSVVVRLIVGALFYGVAANVCYCLGPMLESYVRWLGLRVTYVTQALFITGTVLSVLLTALIGFMMWAAILFSGF